MLICLDPGHSGPIEPGAVGGGFTEAELTLPIAKYVGENLSINGNEVIYTREGDIDNDGLAFRAEIANNAGADLFVSIHLNAAASPAAYGVETYHFPASIDGHRLAEHIQSSLKRLHYTANRGVKSANFAVLRLTNMPAVLVECGFITSDHDRSFLTTMEGQQRIAKAIVAGIEKYKTRYKLK